MPKNFQSSPMEYLAAYAIVFAAGALSTAMLSAYSKFVKNRALKAVSAEQTHDIG